MKRLDLGTIAIGASFLLIILYAGFVLYLWRQGLFDLPDDEAGAQVLAAVLALVGGLFAALLTFGGALLKYSLDERNLALKEEAAKGLQERNLVLKAEAEQRLQIDAQHNRALELQAEERLNLDAQRHLAAKEEAEDRLKLEAYIQAAGLLGTDDGSIAPATQQAAALFLLADVNQLSFALALLGEMWPRGDVSPSAAVWLIDKCLRSDDSGNQVQAADILSHNAQTLVRPGGDFDWPSVITNSWPSGLYLEAGFSTLRALFQCLYSRPVAEWRVVSLNGAILMLWEARETEENIAVRNSAILLLHVLLRWKDAPEEYSFSLSGDRTLYLAQLASEVEQQSREARKTCAVEALEWEASLEEWAGLPISAPTPEDPPSTAPGGGEPTP